MEKEILLNAQSCTKCGKCIKICPNKIFYMANNKQVELQFTDTCISCGHCLCVCPTSSISHSHFPSDKVHSFNQLDYPSSNQLLTLIRGRRSNRSLTNKPIPQEALEMIVEAAYRAPTASNAQGLNFTLVTNPNKLKDVTLFTLDVFGNIIKMVDNFAIRPIVKTFLPTTYKYIPTFKKIRKQFELGDDLILRNSTALLIISAPKSSRFGAEDANLAYQNASLMAESLGLANIYMGFVLSAVRQKAGKLEKSLGIDSKIHAVLALGIPSVEFHSYIDKKPITFMHL